MMVQAHGRLAAVPMPPAPRTFPSCNFCGRELTAIEKWCGCAEMKLGHAGYVIRSLVQAETKRVDDLMGRYFGHGSSA